MTIENYLWDYSIPMIKLMGIDNSHVDYGKKIKTTDLSNKSVEELNNDLGIPIRFPKN